MGRSEGEPGDARVAWEIFWSSELPMRKRLAVTARNIGRRIHPPHDCCGRPGEPGC